MLSAVAPMRSFTELGNAVHNASCKRGRANAYVGPYTLARRCVSMRFKSVLSARTMSNDNKGWPCSASGTPNHASALAAFGASTMPAPSGAKRGSRSSKVTS
jgi:hypothetical protein